MLIFLQRILKNGWKNFIRNPLLSLAASFINSLMISTMIGLIVFSAFSNILIKYIQQKLDLSIYFKEAVSESQIKSLQAELSTFDFIEKINYITKEEALEIFKEKNKGNPLILDALEELGSNPLSASFAIVTKKPEDYEKLAQFLMTSKYRNIIEEITFSRNKEIIDRIVSITNQGKKIIFFIIFTISLIAIIVIFNTIRIIIFSQRREIEIMQLIGSSKNFIKFPYLVTSTLYGIFGIIFAGIIISILSMLLSPFVDKLITNFSLKQYLIENLSLLLLLSFAFSIIINNIATWIAINKYLNLNK